jgi:hypothetical protein
MSSVSGGKSGKSMGVSLCSETCLRRSFTWANNFKVVEDVVSFDPRESQVTAQSECKLPLY